MMRMSDLLESLSMPYVFPGESAFVLGIGSVIVGLLFFRFGVARRRRHKDSAER
jgi:hypothetical protein